MFVLQKYILFENAIMKGNTVCTNFKKIEKDKER